MSEDPSLLWTIGRSLGEQFVTFITCELSIREDQVDSEVGKYELMVTCDDAMWARKILTNVGQMSIDVEFGHGHTLDIGPWVADIDPIQALAFERYANCLLGDQPYGILRLHGLTRPELISALETSVDAILARRRAAGIYPRTYVGKPTESIET